MGYKGYYIEMSDYGWVIQDLYGNDLIELATEEEAYEYIDNNSSTLEYLKPKAEYEKPKEISLYDRFVAYCGKLPGKCFPNQYLATTNEKVLKRFIKSFEESNNCKVIYEANIYGGEYFYEVVEVIDF